MNSKLFRDRLLATTVFCGVMAIASPTLAQTAATAAGETTARTAEATAVEDAETIVVTGSRIASPSITSVSPVQVIDSQAIQQSGITNVQELLLENPAFGSPALTRTNSAFLTSGTGVATVDLRNLGTDRTLVLVNGRRVVAGLPGSATVDLNVIPTQFIERVDILTGGASSLYGSDAVAGVVNFIYKSNFEGIDANAQYNITERGDTPGYQANVTVGSNFSDRRGNIMLHFGYSKEGQLLSRERPETFFDDVDRFATLTGDPADFGKSIEGTFSGLPPQGVFTAGGRQFTFNQNNVLQCGFSASGGVAPGDTGRVPAACGATAGQAIGPNGFNRQFFRSIAVPVQRYLFAARTKYELSDSISFIAEGTYNRTSASRQIEPFGIATAGTTGIFPGGGGFNIQSRVNVTAANPAGTIVNNPLVPQAIFDVATDSNGDGLRDIAFSRRLLEFGTRNSKTDRDFFRFVVGFEGSLFDDKFRWDASYNYGRTKESQEGNGQVNVANFRNALDVVPAGVIPATVGPQCASAQARAAGCVPVNVFGFNSITPAAVAYIQANQTFQTSIQQQVLQGNISGTLFELPGGPLGIAAGVEYRKEKSNENNDSLTNQGLNGGNALPDTAGSFDVKEVYGEINIPIVKDVPFFQELTLRAAGRASDYSTIGTVYSYSGGVEWRPIEDLRFTGTYARAVRAPNIGELFTGPSQTFPSGLTDPCVGVTATTSSTLGTVCRSFAGVNANIAANNGSFFATQSDRQSVSGFNRGNPNLSEERATSYTIGAVLNPKSIDALRNLTLRVDYYNIEIKNAIIGVPRQFILNKCFAEGDQSFCQFIRRRAEATAVNSAGSLEFIDQASVNGGLLKTTGIDFVANLGVPLNAFGTAGNLNFRTAYTHVFKAYTVPVPGDPTQDNFNNEIGSAKDRFTTSVGYSGGKVDVNFTGTYIGKSYLDDQFLAGYDLEPESVGVGAEFYLDTQIRFKPTEQYEVYFGADNLLDNKAPNIKSNVSGNTTGTDTNAGTYDVFGRRFYAGVRLRF